jgi:tetratricopeptide (TPR) repeat protein
VGAEKLVRYSRLAGEQALASYAYEDALGHFQRALAAKEGQPMDTETAAVLHGLGRAQAAMGQIKEAASNLTLAFKFYARMEDVPRAIVIVEHAHSLEYARRMTDAISLALELVPPDSLEAGRILVNYGLSLCQTEAELIKDDLSQGQEAIDRALAIARRCDDKALEMRALAMSAQVDVWRANWRQCLEKCLRAIRLAENNDDPVSELRSRQLAVDSLLVLGEADAAEVHAATFLSAAERLRDNYWLRFALEFNGKLFYYKGEWQKARHYSERRLAIAHRQLGALLVPSLLEYQTGNFGEGDACFEKFMETSHDAAARIGPVVYVLAITAIGVISSITGREELFEDAQDYWEKSSGFPFPPFSLRLWDMH